MWNNVILVKIVVVLVVEHIVVEVVVDSFSVKARRVFVF